MDLLPRATGSCLNTANWTQYPLIKCSLSLLSHSGTLRAPFGACRRLRSDGYLEVIHADDERLVVVVSPASPRSCRAEPRKQTEQSRRAWEFSRSQAQENERQKKRGLRDSVTTV